MNAKQDHGIPENMTFAERCSFTLVYYAAERTLMSWIRAALGMMALGFVIDRFGLVLDMLPNHGADAPSTAYSFWIGAALVFGGAAMAFTAAFRYSGVERRYRHDGCDAPGHGLPLGVLYTFVVGVVGVSLGLILTSLHF